MRRVLAGAAALLLWHGAAQAKVKAVIVEWGEIEAATGSPLGQEYQEHSLGHGRELLSTRFINHDTTIPAQLCRRFGFRAWLTRAPGDVLPSRILLRLRHPVLTRSDGVTGSEDTLMVPVNSGAVGDAFTFDEPYEMQPGEWIFDLLVGDEVAATQRFTIVPREPGSQPSIGAAPPTS